MRRRFLVLVLIAGLTTLVIRGILPALCRGQDFGPVYSSSRVWMQGLDPYDDRYLTVEAARAEIATPVGRPNFQSVYPPLAVIGAAPLALMPYRTARATLIVVNLVALAGCWWMLVRRFRWSMASERALVLAAITVSLAGVHTCLKDGQLTPIVLFGILAALHPGTGLLRGTFGWTLALFKYSIPGPYMVLAALPRRRGDAVPVLLAGGIFVAAVAIVASPVGLDTLIRSYGSSVGDLFAPGARDDPATIGEGSATMLWMPALLYRVFSFAPSAVPAINLAVIAAMICVVVLVILRCREDGRVLLVVSAFALLTSYHRVYDSVLLLPGIAWLIDRGRHGYECEHLLLASLLLPFLLPGPAILQVLLPEGVRNTWAAYALAIPHQTWCLVAVLVVASFGVVVEVVASVGRAGTIPKIAALGFLLSVANVQVAQGVHRSSFPAFAVRVEGGALREYRTPVSPGDAAQQLSDPAINAAVMQIAEQEWELTITPKTNAVTTVWFPWEPDPATSASGVDDAIVYYPSMLGVVVRDTLLTQFGWRGGDYPGQCFAPLVIVANDTDARMAAATNWPPRRVKPMYSRGRIGLRYDERVAAGTTQTYRALVANVQSSSGLSPWQGALDAYKSWLKDRLSATGMNPRSASWMHDLHGWLNVQLQNMPSWDAGTVEKAWARWGRKLAWIQFWGQMSPHYLPAAKATQEAGCCLQMIELHPRYRQDLPALARHIAKDGHVGFYARPRSPYAPLVGPKGDKTSEFTFLRDWLERNRSAYGANAFYVDVLGHQYFGDPGEVAALLKRDIDSAIVIEYPVDIYPTAFLVSGSLGGGSWQGGPSRTPARPDHGTMGTTFPSFGRYLLDDRILFLGESNGDGRWWGPAADYWTERQAFLLGAKFDVIHPTEDGTPEGPEDRALVAAIAARDRSKWWERDPVYLDRRGLQDIPPDVDVRRYRGRQGETLLVVDNWKARSNVQVTVDGHVTALPADRLAIVVVPKSS